MNMRHCCREDRHTVRAKQTWSRDDTTFLAGGNVPSLSCLYKTGAVCAPDWSLIKNRRNKRHFWRTGCSVCPSTSKCKTKVTAAAEEEEEEEEVFGVQRRKEQGRNIWRHAQIAALVYIFQTISRELELCMFTPINSSMNRNAHHKWAWTVKLQSVKKKPCTSAGP